MEDHAADQLDVVVPLPQIPPRRLPHYGKGFREKIIQSIPAR